MKLVHKDFQLNGISFSKEQDLIEFAHTLSTSLATFLVDWFSENDFIVVQTSGSTGAPKPIHLKKEQMKNSALATGSFFEVQEKTKALCCLPVEYIAGKMMVVRALVLGWHLDFVLPSSNPLEAIDKSYDFSAVVPLQLGNSLDKIHLIKKLIVGGGAVSFALQKQLQGLSTQVYATYGMTETITHIAVKSLNTESTSKHYKTLKDVFISADDRDCLVIKAPKISNEIVVTNDVVTLISENEFEWKGRFDNVINSGGIKLHPEEIEKKLAPHMRYRFFVAGIPDERLGEKLVLVIEGKQDVISLNDVQNLKGVLDTYETPKELFFTESFVETETNKIVRKETLRKATS